MFGMKKNPTVWDLMAKINEEAAIPHSRFAQPAAAAAEQNGNVITLRRPEPQPVGQEPLEDLSQYDEYASLAAELGYHCADLEEKKRARSAEIARREVIGFMLDNGMPIYSNDEVSAFMDQLAEAETAKLPSTTRSLGRGITWDWYEVGQHEVSAYMGRDLPRRTWMDPGYSKPIPAHILKRAAVVKRQFKDAVFAVTDYKAVNPDPFISVYTPEFSNRIIFGAWDEPGFGLLKKDQEERA